MKVSHRLFILSLLLISTAFAQSPPKREFRAAWVATVANIDWPSKPGLTAMQQQQEFINRLNQLQQMGCNAVIVQVRPASDAFFESPFEPWSRYLTGKQGQAPSPYYDPLTFMIEQTHSRCMEFHAWFNPFRALTDSRKNPNPPNHITRLHPDWIISYGGKSYINPGVPEARSYVTKVIMDVVQRYDIDAVHLDDYFYPYRIAGQEFGDSRSYQLYGSGYTNKDDWRRGNTNKFVANLNTEMKKAKPYLKFGISPFGVWRNASKDPEGSQTRGGQTCYDDLYADVLLWMKEGWIDYCLPQLYWEHNHRAAAFDVLLPWWNAHSYNRHVYYGLGVYRMAEARSGAWVGAKELLWQIRDIRKQTHNSGHVFYSLSSFDKISTAITDSVHNINATIALPPTMPWIDNVAPAAPFLRSNYKNNAMLLKWEMGNIKPERLYYAVYRFVNNEPINLNRAQNLISLQRGTEFVDAEAGKHAKCTYVVTAVDRLWNESAASNIVVTN